MRERKTLREMNDLADSPRECDVGQVCLNGHGITGRADRYPAYQSKFCPDCGELTILDCQKCGSAIRGHSSGVLTSGYNPPGFCHECGAAYPWTERRTEALVEAIEESELSEDERDKLKLSIPDVINDTPKTQTAVSRFDKAIRSAGQFGGKLLYDVLVKVATVAVVRSMGLNPPQ